MRVLLLISVALAALVAASLVIVGFVLDPPQPPLQRADAIVVISGDEQLARFREGVRLYRLNLATYVLFSGAAYDGSDNTQVMRDLAVAAGVPESAVIEEGLSEDTWGNAVYTRQILEQRGLKSAILVTSPYHVQRAKLTFDAAYQGSGIQLLVRSAPDSDWRKLSWWRQPQTRKLTLSEIEKLTFILVTGRYRQA